MYHKRCGKCVHWKKLNGNFQVFLLHQAIFWWTIINVKKTSMHQVFTVSIELCKAAWEKHPKFDGNSEPWNNTSSIMLWFLFKMLLRSYQFYRHFRAYQIRSLYNFRRNVNVTNGEQSVETHWRNSGDVEMVLVTSSLPEFSKFCEKNLASNAWKQYEKRLSNSNKGEEYKSSVHELSKWP